MKKGISLIILVITIIVIIILAATIILTLSNNNVITQANQSAFKQTVETYNSELSMSITKKYESDYNFIPSTFNATSWDGTEANITGTVKEYIPSMVAKDGSKFIIVSGKLVYVDDDINEKNWIEDTMNSNTSEKLYVTNKSEIPTTNKYKTPYIPDGFNYVEGTWNTGLVIEDMTDNQFVWVPVDGINVPYAKWTTTGVVYNNVNISNDTIPVADEISQITNYGGFYIARYEAGNESNILVSKKGSTVWTNINYTNSKIKAEEMYNTLSVKSGLITGTEWDTTLEWFKDCGRSISESSRSWGNFKDSVDNAYISGKSAIKQVTGDSEYWKVNNIYDIAGNAWEWTSEKYASNYIYRGGGYRSESPRSSAACRDYDLSTYTYADVTFRVVLYIL